MKNSVEITVLNDNRPGRKLLAEHGLSYHIMADGKRILLDTGSSDVYLKNAAKLGLDLKKVDVIVLSHGHWDHGDGLQFMKGKTLITHPESFKKRYHKKQDKSYVGLCMTKNQMQEKYTLQLSREPVYITPNVIFLGQIPHNNNFEAQTTAFEDEHGKDDFITDDSAIAIKTENGLVVISGCAHAGICNTIDYAKQVSGMQKVWAVMGGFHLKKSDDLTLNTIHYIKQLNIQHVIPTHCTELPALACFYDAFKSRQVSTGDCIIL